MRVDALAIARIPQGLSPGVHQVVQQGRDVRRGKDRQGSHRVGCRDECAWPCACAPSVSNTHQLSIAGEAMHALRWRLRGGSLHHVACSQSERRATRTKHGGITSKSLHRRFGEPRPPRHGTLLALIEYLSATFLIYFLCLVSRAGQTRCGEASAPYSMHSVRGAGPRALRWTTWMITRK